MRLALCYFMGLVADEQLILVPGVVCLVVLGGGDGRVDSSGGGGDWQGWWVVWGYFGSLPGWGFGGFFCGFRNRPLGGLLQC